MVRKIPILIARVDFDVTEGGAKYSVVAVPYTDLAYDDRFKYPRRDAPSQATTLEWAMTSGTARTADRNRGDKTQATPDIYKFRIHHDVRRTGCKYASPRRAPTQQCHQPKRASRRRESESWTKGGPECTPTGCTHAHRQIRHSPDQVLRGRGAYTIRIPSMAQISGRVPQGRWLRGNAPRTERLRRYSEQAFEQILCKIST